MFPNGLLAPVPGVSNRIHLPLQPAVHPTPTAASDAPPVGQTGQIGSDNTSSGALGSYSVQPLSDQMLAALIEPSAGLVGSSGNE